MTSRNSTREFLRTVMSFTRSGFLFALLLGVGYYIDVRPLAAGTTSVGSTVTVLPAVQSEAAPTLPTRLNTALGATPSTGRTIRVVDLQRAMDTTVAGDRLVMKCSATWNGNLIIRPSNGGIVGQWRTVTTDCPMPAENVRTGPRQSFARIISPNARAAIATNSHASRVRFIGVEVSTSAKASQGLIALGCPNDCEKSLAEQPYDIIFDRSYIHGLPATDLHHCVTFNGARLALIDSYVTDCHSTIDAQAVTGWNGPGPFKIVNNYLAASTENVAFGGSDPTIQGLVPSDIEIRGNHIVKPLAWKGSPWLVKNLLELKQGRRVLIEGNVFENTWPSAQVGFAFVLWSVNQQTTCKWCVTEHVTIQNNLIRNVSGGWSMVATGANGLPQYLAQPMNHVAIRNNVILGLNSAVVSGAGAYGRLFEISDTISALTIEHNTAFSPTNSSFLWGGAMPLPALIVRNNLVGGGQYQIFTSLGQGRDAWKVVAGPGSAFSNNVVVGFSGPPIPGNWFPGAFADVGLVGSNPFDPNATLDSVMLSPSSAFRGKGTDKKDVGADIAAVKAATANAVQPSDAPSKA